MEIKIPEFSLVVLIGPSGSGKSTFAKKHFLPTEVLSSDTCRGLVSDDENDQAATKDAFAVLHFIAGKRLLNKKLTVIDATNIQPEGRKSLMALAREHDCLPVVIALNLRSKICIQRNESRFDRNFGKRVVESHCKQMKRSLRSLKREGFRQINILSSVEDVEAVQIKRMPLWNNLRNESGPFDIIGDVHGCFDELKSLLEKLGYQILRKEISEEENTGRPWSFDVIPPEGRRLIFLGDLVDRGPKTPDVLHLVMDMVVSGVAFCISGNHDAKLWRQMNGKNVKLNHGLAESVEQLSHESEPFRARVKSFLRSLISHYLFDQGRLVVAHAGMKESFQGRASGRVRSFALYGDTTGETDSQGLPIRYNWAMDYRGKAMVVYGHTPVPEPEWLNKTIDIDTGCVFGASLTALRYPEKELVSVEANEIYCEPMKPIAASVPTIEERAAYDILSIEDVNGKRLIQTRFQRNLTIREGNACSALETMSRFAEDPRWLIYLPPTMSPSATSQKEGYLEYPEEAFSYYRKQGVEKVICEQKHMGSRAVVIVARSPEAIERRFGIAGDDLGICYTRTGRRFFNDRCLEKAFLERLKRACDLSGFWERFETDWFCFDCELMPWSAKAQSLLIEQYAPVGVAARVSFDATLEFLQQAQENGAPVEDLKHRFEKRAETVDKYRQAYREYCWPVNSLDDLKLAPFHVLASENGVHSDKDHLWHMSAISDLCNADEGLLLKTGYCEVDLNDEASCAQGIAWWENFTGDGGEGMVVKPLEFLTKGQKDWIQPAIKCRGREYLRIIYGAEYTLPEHLKVLRKRGLSMKRSLAMREFLLGLEGLERFVGKEPLYRVHECVFGVLALESEFVDPRL